MKRAGLLLICACATWSIPQPMIRTREVATVYERMREGVQTACGGIATEFKEGGLIKGKWQRWPVKEGAFLTHCLATQLPEDEFFTTVRLTFVARYCPGAVPADLEAQTLPCEEAEVIPQTVKDSLDQVIAQVETAVRR